MALIEYDPTTHSLLHPEDRPSLFLLGPARSREALAIEASRLAYLRFEDGGASRQQLLDELALVGYRHVTTFEHADTDGAGFGALHTDGSALITFRGTQADHYKDWLINAKVILQAWTLGSGEVHSGFAETALGLWPQVNTWLKGPAKNRNALCICGHSLGAAIATLLALPAGAHQLITLGSPRVGNHAFAASLNTSPALDIIRIVDCCDEVTQVPPPLMGYKHVGSQSYINRDGVLDSSLNTIQIDADRIAARMVYTTRYGLKPGNEAFRDLADHAPINYARAFWP
ncbi:lipase family protein [Pseudomonas sp. GM55]|uniref:lipase family protein n=1 Tax=Pseudomonas sp. GM55 TaxID=1144333 RepID=UPI000270AECD|nr:lipase family protein [Pseudomonas sp. GM55]EJM76089.1 putative lipase [Pseudomonas sp. GM55]